MKLWIVVALTFILLASAMHGTSATYEKPEPSFRASEGGVVTLHFKGSTLTPIPPTGGNASESAQASGRAFGARWMGTSIGDWTLQMAGDLQIQGQFKAELWAKSDTGARNAGFRINIMINGNLEDSFFTDRKDVGPTPIKFTVSESLTLTVKGGDQFTVNLVWFSDPNRVVGPSGGGEFLYGCTATDSFVAFEVNNPPLIVNITDPEITNNDLTIKARIMDAIGADPGRIMYTLLIQGPTTPTPEHIEGPNIGSAAENGTEISWTWHWRKDKSKSGEYTVTITASYDGNATYSNSTRMELKFPEISGAEGGFLGGGAGQSSIFIGIVMIVIIAIVSAIIFIKKRK